MIHPGICTQLKGIMPKIISRTVAEVDQLVACKVCMYVKYSHIFHIIHILHIVINMTSLFKSDTTTYTSTDWDTKCQELRDEYLLESACNDLTGWWKAWIVEHGPNKSGCTPRMECPADWLTSIICDWLFLMLLHHDWGPPPPPPTLPSASSWLTGRAASAPGGQSSSLNQNMPNMQNNMQTLQGMQNMKTSMQNMQT